MQNHVWKNFKIDGGVTSWGDGYANLSEFTWVCVRCKARFKGHPEIGPGEIENRRIAAGILENCQEEWLRRIMES